LRTCAAGGDGAGLEWDRRALRPTLLELGLVVDAMRDEDLLEDFVLGADRLQDLLVLLQLDICVGNLRCVCLS
jgi:hypothetical protein